MVIIPNVKELNFYKDIKQILYLTLKLLEHYT